MGQDYIIKPVGRFLRINLDDLDPDGTGPDGGMFQCGAQLSILPTITGVWLDWWNVKGYLVKLRAQIYAEQLKEPQPCLRCGQIHIRYTNIMCATGRQISLACQILPFGIIMGKCCEYCNDPPLFYWGEELECCMATTVLDDMQARPRLGKGKLNLKLLLLIGDAAALFDIFVVPVFRRLAAIGLYVFIMLGIFAINEDNLVTLGADIIQYAFLLAVCKAAGEGFLSTFSNFVSNMVYKQIKPPKHELSQETDIARTVAGQVGTGAVVSCILVISMPLNDGMSKGVAIVIASLVGYALSMVTVFCNYCLEREPRKLGMPPKPSAFSTIVKFLFSVVIAAVTALFTANVFPLRTIIGCGIAVVGCQMLVMKLVLTEESTLLFENTDIGVLKPLEGEMQDYERNPERVLSSMNWKVLTSKLQLPGVIGCLVAAGLGQMFSDVIGAISVYSHGVFPCVLAGVPCGIFGGLSDRTIRMLGMKFWQTSIQKRLIWTHENPFQTT
jgi:hypothetical protein